MNMDEEEYSALAYGGGCHLHGEEYLQECTMCGIEYCAACFRHATLCADCAAQAAFEDEEDAEPTDEEKDLLLASDFNDDEPSEDYEAPSPPPPPKKKAKAKSKTKASVKAKAKPKGKTAPKKTKAKAKPAPKKAKTKPKAKKPVKAKAKATAKPKAKSKTKPSAKKRKA